jgi:predicted enzyme related to lactoylglutathione lyase
LSSLPLNNTLPFAAHKFYSEVFNWKFKEMEGEGAVEHPPSEIRMFDFSPDVSLSGGIQKLGEKTGPMKAGPGGPVMYWLVEDIEKIGDVIEKAGGKMLTATAPEGKSGLYRFFEDTEGTIGGVYQFIG